MRRRLLLATLLAGLGVLGLASPAFAHNVLVGSQPANNAQVTTGPTQVRLDFNAPVQQGPNVITVIGPGGTHWERTERATVDGDSVYTAVAPLGPAGRYTVGYRIISADGHPVSGEVSFTLTQAGTGQPVTPTGGAGPATAGASTGAGSAGGGGAPPVWVWVVAAVVVLGIGLTVALRIGGGREARRR